jgi:hypothetical protein
MGFCTLRKNRSSGALYQGTTGRPGFDEAPKAAAAKNPCCGSQTGLSFDSIRSVHHALLKSRIRVAIFKTPCLAAISQ